MLYPQLEQELISQGYKTIIGIDEVGRGCLAGPVAVGAFAYTLEDAVIEGIKDSKLLSASKRELLYPKLSQFNYAVAWGDNRQIDELGIAVVIEKLIQRLITQFNNDSAYFLIDGYFKTKFGDNTKQIIDGDAKHYSIGAASILAKVERDQHMVTQHDIFPKYFFTKNKGYGTAEHMQSLRLYGRCEIHRHSFTTFLD